MSEAEFLFLNNLRHTMLYYVVTILLTFIVGPAIGQVCPYRECTCLGTVIDCSNRNLQAIPTRLNTGVSYTTLLLNDNMIRNITSNDSLPISLDTLDLSGNPISNIASQALFGVAQTLKNIKFKNSQFSALPSALEILDNLETLDFENDSITFPELTVAKLASTVVSLRLANIGLSPWPVWLSYFVFLKRLYLDFNTRLHDPPVGTFDMWKNSLTHLSLSYIGANSVSAIAVLQKLEYLDISRNNITDSVALSYDLIPAGATLKYLDASRNNLMTEPRLADLRVLTEVHLGFNKIANVTSGSFSPSITTINIDNNQFTSVPAFLSELPQVLNFSMQYNRVSLVEAHDFPANSRLTAVYLGNNPIDRIDEHAFDNFKNTLTYLDLQNTHLTRLPLALTVLTKLETLFMVDNERMMCSCEEKSTAPWIHSLPNLRIVGTCGHLDIKDFIELLGLDCP